MIVSTQSRKRVPDSSRIRPAKQAAWGHLARNASICDPTNAAASGCCFHWNDSSGLGAVALLLDIICLRDVPDQGRCNSRRGLWYIIAYRPTDAVRTIPESGPID